MQGHAIISINKKLYLDSSWRAIKIESQPIRYWLNRDGNGPVTYGEIAKVLSTGREISLKVTSDLWPSIHMWGDSGGIVKVILNLRGLRRGNDVIYINSNYFTFDEMVETINLVRIVLAKYPTSIIRKDVSKFDNNKTYIVV